VSVEDDERSGRPSTKKKQQKIFTKFQNSSTKTIAEQSMTSQTPLASVMDEKDQKLDATTIGSFNTTTCPPTRH
jgi:hypothetical protein